MTGHRTAAPRVLFRVAAGPRMGYGHLVRATVLARACDARPLVSVRGGTLARRTARQLGCRIAEGTPDGVLRSTRPDIVVIDDPSPVEAGRFCRAARRCGARVASVHDLGLGYCGADLTIDGSVAHPHGTPSGPALLGPRYAILSPCDRRTTHAGPARNVLIALGGGPRRLVARRLADVIARRHPGVAVRIAGGFAPHRTAAAAPGVTWLGPQRGLARELAQADVAVVGGGVTLYEACCSGTPAVGLAVVPAQRPTIRAFARLGAARDGGSTRRVHRAADEASRLLAHPGLRSRVARTSRTTVDGRGALRVARAILRLAAAGSGDRAGRPR